MRIPGGHQQTKPECRSVRVNGISRLPDKLSARVWALRVGIVCGCTDWKIVDDGFF